MRDMVGNKIREGDLLYWRETGLVAKVTKLTGDSGLALTGMGQLPPTMFLEITVPINTQGLPPGEEPQVPSMVKIVDPKQERLLASVRPS